MIRRLVLPFFFFAAFQMSHRIEIKGYEFIQEMVKSDSTYLGTMLGKPMSSGLFKEILIVEERRDGLDTLCQINAKGLWNKRGVNVEVAGEAYDGYKIDFLRHDSFGVSLVKLPDGPSSDEMIIIWNDSSRVFEMEDEP